jgi:hypothetical protein
MIMANVSIKSQRANPKNPTSVMLRSWYRLGYLDRTAGLPFRPEYDAIGPNRQLNYENGRLMAARLQGAKVKSPKWPEGSFHPKGLSAALMKAARA